MLIGSRWTTVGTVARSGWCGIQEVSRLCRCSVPLSSPPFFGSSLTLDPRGISLVRGFRLEGGGLTAAVNPPEPPPVMSCWAKGSLDHERAALERNVCTRGFLDQPGRGNGSRDGSWLGVCFGSRPMSRRTGGCEGAFARPCTPPSGIQIRRR
jgi:hypothetical protein